MDVFAKTFGQFQITKIDPKHVSWYFKIYVYGFKYTLIMTIFSPHVATVTLIWKIFRLNCNFTHLVSHLGSKVKLNLLFFNFSILVVFYEKLIFGYYIMPWTINLVSFEVQ